MASGFDAEDCVDFYNDETIDAIAEALTALGYRVDRVGNARALISRLASYDREDSFHCPWDIVFNICAGRSGIAGREGHVPSILECYNIPFVLSDSSTFSLCLDKAKTKMVLEFSGIATAPFAVVHPGQTAEDAIQKSPHRPLLYRQLPLFVKPCTESTGKGIWKMSKITNWSQLNQVVQSLQYKFPGHDMLIEKFLNGREFTVGIVGTGENARVIFAMEIKYRLHETKADHDAAQPIASEDDADFYSFAIKSCVHWNEIVDLCNGSDQLATRAGELALRAYRCMGCRDVGRIDVRCDVLDPDLAQPHIMELNPLPGIQPGYSDLVKGAEFVGISYEALVGQIMDSALNRLNLVRNM